MNMANGTPIPSQEPADYGPEPIPPDELIGTPDDPTADPENAEAERLLHQMANDPNNWLRAGPGRWTGNAVTGPGGYAEPDQV